MSKKIFWYSIIALVFIRIILVALLMFGVPSLGNVHFENHIPWAATGDEHYYFNVAKDFARFHFRDEWGLRGIGTFLVYVPYIWLTGAQDRFDLFPSVFYVQAFVMYPLAIVFVGLAAKNLLKSRGAGAAAAAAFTFYPYVVYLANLGPYEHNYNHFLDAMWLRSVLSDVPSAFFVLLAVMLFALSQEKKSKKYSALAGLAAGMATLIRLTNILICAAIGITYLWQKKFKEFALFAVLAFAIFSPQLIFNKANYGGYLAFGRFQPKTIAMQKERYPKVHLPGRIAKRGVTPQNYLYLLTILDKYVPAVEFVLAAVAAWFVVAFNYLRKISLPAAVFLFLWTVFYIGLYAAFDAAARNLRYYLPVIPALLILGVVFVWGLGKDMVKLYYKVKPSYG